MPHFTNFQSDPVWFDSVLMLTVMPEVLPSFISEVRF